MLVLRPMRKVAPPGQPCHHGGNPRPHLIDKKDTLKALALERSLLWREIGKIHLSGRTAAFFCYGDDGANEEDGNGKPLHLAHPEWFDAKSHPQRGADEHMAYQGLVWQCRYSDIEVSDGGGTAPPSALASLSPTIRPKTWFRRRKRWRGSTPG